jgi:hypothetical protein
MEGAGGYNRYDDKPNYVECPRARTVADIAADPLNMTPCVARDGRLACADDRVCAGCGEHPADLLRALVEEVTQP